MFAPHWLAHLLLIYGILQHLLPWCLSKHELAEDWHGFAPAQRTSKLSLTASQQPALCWKDSSCRKCTCQCICSSPLTGCCKDRISGGRKGAAPIAQSSKACKHMLNFEQVSNPTEDNVTVPVLQGKHRPKCIPGSPQLAGLSPLLGRRCLQDWARRHQFR